MIISIHRCFAVSSTTRKRSKWQLRKSWVVNAPCTMAHPTIHLSKKSIMAKSWSPFSRSQNHSKDTRSCRGRISWSYSAWHVCVDGRWLCEDWSSIQHKLSCIRQESSYARFSYFRKSCSWNVVWCGKNVLLHSVIWSGNIASYQTVSNCCW